MPKILVVEDEPELAELTKLRLQANNYEVIVAHDGLACLEKAKAEKPDVILLDLVMPVMNGYEACCRLKQMPEAKDIPVILFTASYARSIEEKAKELDAFDYLIKPFEPAELLRKISRALRK